MSFARIYQRMIELYSEENYIENMVEVNIDGIGSAVAEADTGNSGYNVLHGKIIKIGNGRVSFQTLNNKVVEKPIAEFITAVTGSSNEEQRPVVLLDLMVNGYPHNRVPFSISDRSTNDKKILLGKPFLKEITNFVKI
jgi:hypothetical protein